MNTIRNQNLVSKSSWISEKLLISLKNTWLMLRRISLFILLLIITGCTSSYHEHFFRENPEFASERSVVSGEIFVSDGRVESLPNTTFQKELIEIIDTAKNRIWIEIYTWTDAAKITESILNAKKRWLDVQVVLEWNVFGTPRINSPIAKKLKDAGIPVTYADNQRYSFTHAKFWVIDDIYFISTGNWTASFFAKNREYVYIARDSLTLRFLEDIFRADMTHMGYKGISRIPAHMVVSPLDSRAKIENLILSTQKTLTFYIQTLSDDHIIALISELQNQWKDIQICTADNESNRARMTEFPSWHWKLVKKPYIHAKVIIVDDNRIFIGSHNLTTNAIENNREMWIIIDNRSDIQDQIQSDFARDGCR